VKAEVVGVGTELLLGQIANTNAQKISSALASVGVDVYYHTAVGDNLGRITDVLSRAIERSKVVVTTGGLGPTSDDVTREAVAQALGVRLVRHEELAAELRSFFERRGRRMPESNLRQVDLPLGAVPIPAEGTAPGFHIERDGRLLIALPGVPWEMEAMLAKAVLPLLTRLGGGMVTMSREVLVAGLGESHTQERIAEIVDAQSNPTIAYLAGYGLVRVRLTAKAANEGEALALIAPVESEIRARLGKYAIHHEGSSLGQVVGNMLRDRDATVGVAESLTGGLIAAALTEAEGASDFFLGSIVAYATEAKRDVIGVPREILDQHGPVSEPAARALAEEAARVFGADLGLSATGVAGPTEQDGMPVGTIYVGAHLTKISEVRLVHGYGSRDSVRRIAVTSVLDLARRVLQSV
jgi:nicotinamide-nucleotide amidase